MPNRDLTDIYSVLREISNSLPCIEKLENIDDNLDRLTESVEILVRKLEQCFPSPE